MATSARIAALLEQRRALAGLSGSGKIRLLSPTNTSVNSIAKAAATNELNVMVSRYNNGEVSNEEMRNFLTKMSGNISLSANDRLDVANQIKEFDSRIQSEALQAAYKAAPDNSVAQMQAAQALANFYNAKAASQTPNTPAQSATLQSAADWNSQVQTINQNIKKVAAQNLRYQQEAKVNAIPDNTSAQAAQKAEMYKTLYDQAVADGDQTGANKYAAYYQDAITATNTLQQRESDQAQADATKANKKQLSDFINTTLNDYHDGKISGDQALASLESANQFAYDIGDTAALNRLNGLSITINREIDKGVTYSSVNGLSTKSKGGGGSGEVYLNPDGSLTYGGSTTSSGKTGGSVKTSTGKVVQGSTIGGSGTTSKSLTEMAIEYKNNLNEANKALVDGYAVVDGKKIPFDAKAYTTFVTAAAKKRQLELINIKAGLDQLSANGVKKIGKNSVETMRQDIATELGQVTAEYNGIKGGNLVLAMQAKNFTDPAGNTVSKPQLTFVPKNKVSSMVEAGGVYYPTRQEGVVYQDQKMAQAYAKNNSTPDNPLTVQQNAAGQFEVVDNKGANVARQLLDITDVNGNKITYENDAKYGWLPQAVGPKTTALRAQMVKEADAATKANQGYQPNLMTYNQVVAHDFSTPVGITKPLPPPPPSTANKVTSAVQSVPNKVVAAVKSAPAVVNEPVFNPSTQLIPSGGTQAAINTAPPATTLKLATQTPSPVAQLAKSTGAAPVKIPAPPATKIPTYTSLTPTQYVQQKVVPTVKNVINSLATKIKKIF